MSSLHLGTIVVDLEAKKVSRDGSELPLARKEFEILAYLAQRPNQDVAREELYEQVWGYRPNVVSRTLDTTMHRLRTKLEENPSNPTFIRTVHGIGYRLVQLTADAPPGMEAVGRDRERVWLSRHPGPVLVAGLPGIGKSSLLRSVYGAASGAQWVDARQMPHAELVRIVERFPTGGTLVIEGLQQVPEALASSARSRLDVCLRVEAVSSMGWDGPVLTVGPLGRSAVAAILKRRLEDQLVDPMPSEEQLRRLAAASEGMPCVIESIARALPLIGPNTAAERIEQDPPEIPQCSVDMTAQWEALGEPVRELLVQLACLGGEVHLSTLEGIMGGPVVAGLDELRARGWVAASAVDGRVRMYRVVRGHVRRYAPPEAWRRAQSWAGAWAEAKAEEVVAAEVADPQLLGEEGTLAGFQQVAHSGSPPETDAWFTAFDALLTRFGSLADHMLFLDDALERKALSATTRLRLLVSRANAGVHHHRPTVLEDTSEVVSSAEATDMDRVRALALRGLYHQQTGDTEAAAEDLATAEAIAGSDPRSLAILLLATAEAAYSAGDLAKAEAALRTAHDHAVKSGSQTLAGAALAKLAVVLADTMQVSAARVTLDQGRRLRASTSHRTQVATALTEGRIAMQEGDRSRASEVLRDTLELADASGLQGACTLCETSLAWLCLADDDVDQACTFAMSSFDRWPHHRNPQWLGTTRVALAVVHLRAGDLQAARELLVQASHDLAADRRNQAFAHLLLAVVAAAQEGGSQPLQQAELDRALELAGDDPMVQATHTAVDRWHRGEADDLAAVPAPYGQALAPIRKK